MSTATSTAATEKATPIYTSGVAFTEVGSSVVKVNLVAIAIKAILVVHGLLSYLVPRNHLTGGGGGGGGSPQKFIFYKISCFLL